MDTAKRRLSRFRRRVGGVNSAEFSSLLSKSLVLSRSSSSAPAWGKHSLQREIMRHFFLTPVVRNTPLSLRALATKQSTHWPRIATHNCHRALLFPKTSIRTMASIHIDDKVKALINNSYPQTQDAGDDPHKLSTSAYPHVEVRFIYTVNT